MKNTHAKFLFAAFVTVLCASANADCSDSEYRIYQQYDQFLDANPTTPDNELRVTFAKKIGIQPSELKNLYMRCLARWSKQSPKESSDHMKKGIDGFTKDCAQRPAGDPYCKSVLGK